MLFSHTELCHELESLSLLKETNSKFCQISRFTQDQRRLLVGLQSYQNLQVLNQQVNKSL